MKLHEEFRLFETLWDSLTEAKADTQRLVDFAGEDLASRFLAIKGKFKYPENDLYYWINNKTVNELETAIITAEKTSSNRQLAKVKKLNGAELVGETEHWKIYHITTFEASQMLGRDTTWCITGVNNYGDKYWKDYTNKGIEFYFLITKDNYDPRGTNSKFAFAVYPNQIIELYNQQDLRVPLEAVPYCTEISIPGVDLSKIVPDTECAYCHEEVDADDAYLGTDGLPYCEKCFYACFDFCAECGNTFRDNDLILTTQYRNAYYCVACVKNRTDTQDGLADIFYAVGTGVLPIEELSTEVINKAAQAWFNQVAQENIRFDQKSRAFVEKRFKEKATANGITFDQNLFK